jgi:hypothetical protein
VGVCSTASGPAGSHVQLTIDRRSTIRSFTSTCSDAVAPQTSCTNRNEQSAHTARRNVACTAAVESQDSIARLNPPAALPELLSMDRVEGLTYEELVFSTLLDKVAPATIHSGADAWRTDPRIHHVRVRKLCVRRRGLRASSHWLAKASTSTCTSSVLHEASHHMARSWKTRMRSIERDTASACMCLAVCSDSQAAVHVFGAADAVQAQ